MASRSRRSLVRGAAAAATGAALVVLAAGCFGGGGGPSPASILARSAAATAKQTSFHLVVSIANVPASKTGMSLTFVDGDVVVPDRIRARIGGTLQGVPLNSELVVVGGKHFLKDPFTGAWRRIELGLSPVAFLDPAEGVLAVIKGATSLASDGSEQVGGVDCYRLKAKVRSAALTPLLGNPSGARLLPVVLWIGKKDWLLRRIRLSGAVAPGEPAQAVRTVEVSRFGERVTIVAPAAGGQGQG